MGLTHTIQAGVASAFKAIGDLNKTITYKSLTGAVTRDLDAGTVTPVSVDYVIKQSVFVKFKDNEIDAQVSVMTDEKLIFPRQLLPVEPKATDIIVDNTGRTWEVTRRLSDAAAAACVVQVRTSR